MSFPLFMSLLLPGATNCLNNPYLVRQAIFLFDLPNSLLYTTYMYICICKGITEEKIRAAIKHSRSPNTKEVLRKLGVGTDCGTCLLHSIDRIISETKSQKNLNPSSKK